MRIEFSIPASWQSGSSPTLVATAGYEALSAHGPGI